MAAWLDGLLAVLLAPTCGACRQPLLHPTRGCICDPCWNAVVHTPLPLCRRCGGQLATSDRSLDICADCVRHRPLVAGARAIGPYSGALREIVHALKYDVHRSVARPLALLMRGAAADLVDACDAVVPVPLHPARRRARGFNQAADLAGHLGPPIVHALRRVRRTETQTALPAGARHDNVAGAFAFTRDAARLRGGTALLVDDVRTTGATLDACAQVLIEAGVREVLAVTAARVETPGS